MGSNFGEGIIGLIVCIAVAIDCVYFMHLWSNGERIRKESYQKGYDDCESTYMWLENNEDKALVNNYLKKAVILQIENDGSYKRGDKKCIKECDSHSDLEEKVFEILHRK